jgi:hypothetical protein
MIIPTPMPLGQQSKPFDDPDWLYEIKHDGFRALALIDRGHCWFVSRRKHKFHGFRELAAALVREVNAEMAVRRRTGGTGSDWPNGVRGDDETSAAGTILCV